MPMRRRPVDISREVISLAEPTLSIPTNGMVLSRSGGWPMNTAGMAICAMSLVIGS